MTFATSQYDMEVMEQMGQLTRRAINCRVPLDGYSEELRLINQRILYVNSIPGGAFSIFQC
jgi:hypothetical protein